MDSEKSSLACHVEEKKVGAVRGPGRSYSEDIDLCPEYSNLLKGLSKQNNVTKLFCFQGPHT